MGKFTPNQFPVHLTAEEQERLQDITRNGKAPAGKIRHAQVLLLSDHNRPDGHWTEPQIAEALGMHRNTVARIRKRFVLEGERPALDRKKRETPPVPPKIDGRVEAHLVAICCGPAPEGRTRWTLQLLADELKRRGLVTQVSGEAVRLTLKKINCNPGGNNRGASQKKTPPASSPRWKMSSTSTSPTTRRKSR
jgi:transposase